MPGIQRVYFLCGPSLAGKSTACRRIAESLGAAVISADAINAERGLPFGAEGLAESVWAATLRLELLALRRFATEGRSVIVDDTQCYRWLRDRLREEAAVLGLPATLLLLAPSRDELLARHAALALTRKRPVLSRASFVAHLESFEWPTAEEGAVDIGSAESLSAWLGAEAAANDNTT
jgi:predicted kinase